jgi:hypothetical protein
METVNHNELTRSLTSLFCDLAQVEAIALGGSQTAGATDPDSDLDLYVYTTSEIPVDARTAIVDQLGATCADLDLRFWDLGDEWYDASTGIEVDVIYWDTTWIASQIDRVLVDHQASLGYSTCFWYTVLHSRILFDRRGWLRALKDRCSAPYPESLRTAIIAKNRPVLRDTIPSYLHQIEKALRREDLVSLNHRVAALLASYFDLLFALNRLPHPGEKRLLEQASQSCTLLPDDMAEQVEAVLRAAASGERQLVARIHDLVDGLELLM